ncbi:MAG: diacylglycerol kinase family protein [Anaerolineaceae bacterium]
MPANTTSRVATLLVNPAARGVGETFDGGRVLRYLSIHGISTRLVVPSSPADASRAARESADRGDDLLFTVGGDGTVRDVALGLRDSPTALAAIPAGTVNIWATEAGIPKRLRAALDAHISGQIVSIDLGLADGRCFLLMAGIGWDAQIAHHVSIRVKRVLGDIAYVVQAAWMAPRLRTRVVTWRSGGERFQEPLAWMVLGNTRLYGGRVQLTPDATIDDGLLDLVALCPPTLADCLRLGARVALSRAHDDRHIIQYRTAEVRVETPGLAVQLDGDYAGETPMAFSIAPRALRVSVPAGPLSAIFHAR